MHPSQASLLKYLQENSVIDMDQFTLRSLAEKLKVEVHPQKMVHHIHQLEKNGLICYDRYKNKITARVK